MSGQTTSIATRFFGTVDCAPEDVITFPAGILPFVDSTHFILISNERKRPLVFLQSLDDTSLCFVTVPIGALDPNYRLEAQPADLALLRWAQDRPPTLDDLTCLTILTIPNSGTATANLAAPVLINTAERLGVQSVRCDGKYAHAQALDQLTNGAGRC